MTLADECKTKIARARQANQHVTSQSLFLGLEVTMSSFATIKASDSFFAFNFPSNLQSKHDKCCEQSKSIVLDASHHIKIARILTFSGSGTKLGGGNQSLW